MGRLMKYDLRAAMKLFVPLWLGTLVLALFNSFTVDSFFQATDNQIKRIMAGLLVMAYLFAVLAIVVITLIYIVLRFYQATMKDEAYLTFTLPVGIDAIVWSKALSGLLVLCGSVVVCAISVLVLVRQEIQWEVLLNAWNRMIDFWKIDTVILLYLLLLLLLLTGCLRAIFHAYLSMSLGQLAQKHKIGMSVLAYVVINVMCSVIGVVIGIPGLFLLITNRSTSVLAAWTDYQVIQLVMGMGILNNLLYLAVYYVPSRYLLKNRLNLE